MKKLLTIAFILVAALAKLQGQTLTVSPATVPLTAVAGATGTFNITATLTTWSIIDDAVWLSVSQTTGTTDAIITLTAEENTSAIERTAIVSVSGTGGVSTQTVTVTQAGTVTLSVSPSTVPLAATSGSTGTFDITSNTSWTVAETASWLDVSATSGSDNITITVTANSANTSATPRAVTITVAATGATDQTVTVTQAGTVTLSVSPSTVPLAAASGSTGTFDITSNTSWTVAETASWLDVSATSGSDNITITVTANSANTSATPRAATVTVAATGATDQTVTITQAGTVTLSVSPSTVSLAAASGSAGTFNITSNTSWTVAETASWLDVSATSGSDNITITVTANSANTSATPRAVTITVAATGATDQTVTVTQAGTVTLSVSPSTVPLAAASGSTGTFDITSNTSWTVAETASWLDVSATSGSDNITITVTANSANTSATPRAATVTVAATGATDQTVTITQAGTVTLSVSPSTVSLAAASGSAGTFNITSNTSWTVVETASWLDVSATSGSDNITITVTANSANTSATPRAATVTVAATGATDQTVTVTQAGIPTYVISLSVNPPSSGTTSGGGTYNEGSLVTVTATPNAGYAFVNWTESGTQVSTNASYTFTASTNRTLVANFVATYNIAVSANPAGSGTVSGGGTYNSGASVTVTAAPNTGYSFVNWTESGTQVSTNASYNFTASTNRTLVANFVATYTIAVSASPAGSGTVTGGGTYNSGASVTVTAAPNTGYSFVNWTESGTQVSTNASYNFTASTNRTLVANFVATYTIAVSASPAGSGTVTGGGTYNSGASVTVTAAPNAGYSFVNWTESGTQVSTNASYNFTASTNRTLVANFVATYTIAVSASPAGSGTVTGGGTYNSGASVTVTAAPNAGYSFVNWTESGTQVSTNASYNFTASTSRTLVANFLATYTIAVSASPAGSGTVSGGGTYNSGSSVTVTATPNAGYVFVNWTEAGTQVSTNSSYTFPASANRTLVANFLATYNIAVSASPAGSGTVTGGGTYNFGSSVTVTATPNAGYAFVNWTESGTQVSTNASYTFTASTNRTLVANFVATYNIAVSANPAGSGTVSGGGTYNSGASVTVTAAPNTGYSFVNWTESGTQVSTNASYNFTASTNRTLVANFVATYTIAVSASPAGSGTVTGGGTYNSGTSVTVTATPNAGYVFVNWTEAGTQVSTNSSYTFPASANRTLVANFLRIYTVSTSSNPAIGGSTTGSGTYNTGTSVTVTATPASGYQFVNWTEGGTSVSTNPNYTFIISANRNLTANFSVITFTVATSSSPASGGTTSGSGIYNSNASATVIATPATGYQFINWTQGGSVVSTSANYTFTVTANRTLVANFNLISYSISTSANPVEGGNVSGGGTFNYGTSVTITASPATGYQFINWTESGVAVSTNPSYTFTATANRTLLANFSLIIYTVSTSSSPAAGGSTAGGGSYIHGSSVTVVATPSTGYQFINWTQSGTVVSTSISYTFAATTNRTLVANFSLLNYSINVSPSPAAGGSSSGGGTYSHGTSVTVTASPATGYQFVNWTESGMVVSTSNSYSFTANSNRTLVANFSVINYTISTSSNPAAGGTTTGGGSYGYGGSATVTATPAAGYLFSNWTEGGTVVSTNVNFTFTVTANRTFVANFSLITYTINSSSSPAAGGTTGGGGTFIPGTSVTLTATPASGYQFLNWSEAGAPVSTNQTYTFTVNANRTLVASFQSITYITVNTLSSPASGGSTSGGGTYTSGSSVTITATAASDYRFVNWTESGTPVSASESYTFTVTANRSLVANFNPITFNVSTSSNPAAGGTTSGGGTYNSGSMATVIATPATGYRFVNWTLGGSAVSTSANYEFTVTANRTLVANFSQITYTIGVSSSPAAGGTTAGGGIFNSGSLATVTATPSSGYQFVNWTEGGSVVSENSTYSFFATGNRSLLANFSQITYTISISSNPSAGGSANGNGVYNSGSSATVSATPADGYQFVNWTQGGISVSSNSSYTFIVTSNVSLVANFIRITYAVTVGASPVAGGVVNGGGTFTSGTSVTVIAVPSSGYRFVNWIESGAEVSTNANYTFPVSANRNLLASFSLMPVILNLTGPEGKPLINNDTIKTGHSDAGSFSITVESNADWSVKENSLWFKAVKENNTSVRVTYMENISVINKSAPLNIINSGNDLNIIIEQKGRISNLNISKFENIKLYPNPVNDRVYLYFGDDYPGKIWISIASVQGLIIQTKEFNDTQANQIIEMDVARLRAGQYFIRISDGKDQGILHMIKH